MQLSDDFATGRRLFSHINVHFWLSVANGHTTLKAPVLVRSPKLSNVGPRLVLGWVTAWEHRVLSGFFFFLFLSFFFPPSKPLGRVSYLFLYVPFVLLSDAGHFLPFQFLCLLYEPVLSFSFLLSFFLSFLFMYFFLFSF